MESGTPDAVGPRAEPGANTVRPPDAATAPAPGTGDAGPTGGETMHEAAATVPTDPAPDRFAARASSTPNAAPWWRRLWQAVTAGWM